MDHVSIEVILAAAKIVTVGFGFILTFLSLKAYRRTGSESLGTLTLGIGLLTTGALMSGLFHQILELSLAYSVTVQAIFTAFGFAIMTFSLFTEGISNSVTDTSLRWGRSN